MYRSNGLRVWFCLGGALWGLAAGCAKPASTSSASEGTTAESTVSVADSSELSEASATPSSVGPATADPASTSAADVTGPTPAHTEADPEQEASAAASPEPAVTGEPVRIAFISYGNPQHVVRDVGPIVHYLEPLIGRPIKYNVTLDFGSAIEAMRGDQADFAFVDPLAFMMAHEQIGARPLLLEIYYGDQPTYHSSIWVRKDSNIKTLEDLRGKKIAFADQIDMSGHLLPRDVFVKEGLLPSNRLEGEFFERVYFAGGDEQAIRAVLNGFVDAAGVSQFAYLLLGLDERDQVTTIADSMESPSHLIMVRKGVDEQIAERLKNALLRLDLTRPADKQILDRLYGVRGFAEAKLSDFAGVAEVAKRYGFVKDPTLFQNVEQQASSK